MNIVFAHVNLIAKDWKKLAGFYQEVFGCEPVPPERNLKGPWLDKGTGIPDAHIQGIHLRLPGCVPKGPTLEIFQYDSIPEHPATFPNTPGFSHISFAVDDVQATARAIFERGGAPVGELIVQEITGVGLLTFQYVADPEGNILEIQNWKKDKPS